MAIVNWRCRTTRRAVRPRSSAGFWPPLRLTLLDNPPAACDTPWIAWNPAQTIRPPIPVRPPIRRRVITASPFGCSLRCSWGRSRLSRSWPSKAASTCDGTVGCSCQGRRSLQCCCCHVWQEACPCAHPSAHGSRAFLSSRWHCGGLSSSACPIVPPPRISRPTIFSARPWPRPGHWASRTRAAKTSAIGASFRRGRSSRWASAIAPPPQSTAFRTPPALPPGGLIKSSRTACSRPSF